MDLNLRPLHLHTLESLCADLISARPVGVGKNNDPFLIATVEARSILDWYFRNRSKWAGNVMTQDVEAIVDSIIKAPEEIPNVEGSSTHSLKQYTLIKVQAHQFSGLHHPGTASNIPDNFLYEFDADLTMFEGFNGCGKTSLLNAIIWALTGEILRPQRLPEGAATEFECEIFDKDSSDTSIHKLTPVMPLPDPTVYRPTVASLPADTWVELTFRDEAGVTAAPVRRAQTRTARGKLEEIFSGVAHLGLDPIAVRTGTVMPGMLPFIQVGTESKLGKAVAELTGMAPLVKLASHAERAKRKIDGDLTKERNREIEAIDTAYNRSLTDLTEKTHLNPTIAFPHTIPYPSADLEIEKNILQTVTHFENLKTSALADAKQVLGESFDANNADARSNLEVNISPAISAVRSLGTLPSAMRLGGLAKLTEEEIDKTEARIEKIFFDAKTLADLAADPTRAGRIRLYSRVANWVKDHPDAMANEDVCVVCGQSLEEAIDAVTGLTVKQHLREATATDALLLSQTLSTWSKLVLGELAHDLPSALQQELRLDLPEHPGALIRKAVIEELFAEEPFHGVLNVLKADVQAFCDAAIADLPALPALTPSNIARDLPELYDLQKVVKRLTTALSFSKWRNANKKSMTNFFATVVGQMPSEEKITIPSSLLGHLQRLQTIVEGVEPINNGLSLCERMRQDIVKRRKIEHRLSSYTVTSKALQECMKVGDLAEQQVEQLQTRLQKSAVTWRNRVYQGAFPSTNHDLVATKMTGEGQLELLVGANGLSAPAQHVTNASALRASLIGFFIAYWEYLLHERGGLRILLLDDPQELLDGDNRERLAKSSRELVLAGAQLVITTHDTRFAKLLAKNAHATNITIDHQYIHPATKMRGTIYLSPSISIVQKNYEAYFSNPDNPSFAQEYVSECRIFIEGRLGDIFDGAAFPSAVALNFAPTLSDHLGRLRGLVKNASNELFRSVILSKFCKDIALKDGAPTLALLNKAHHSLKAEISPTDVASSRADLERLRRSVEEVHEEFRLFRHRDKLQSAVIEIPDLEPNVIPPFKVEIRPNLAAFVYGSSTGESQETELEEISSQWFEDKAFYLLRSGNLGFAGPATSIAVVEATASVVEDRRLVIARRGSEVYARRLLRPLDSGLIALAAETPDPRKSPQTLLFDEADIAIHRVVGMLFGDAGVVPLSKQEAVRVDGSGLLPKVRIAYRIKEDSAVPLALPGQIALGGAHIPIEEFDLHIGAYVALHLSDGTSIFKRVGDKLPPPLTHLRCFETIGGLGVADVLAVGQPQPGIHYVEYAVLILGVLYHI